MDQYFIIHRIGQDIFVVENITKSQIGASVHIDTHSSYDDAIRYVLKKSKNLDIDIRNVDGGDRIPFEDF